MIFLQLPEELQSKVSDYYESIQMSKFVHNEQVYEYLNNCISNEIQMFQIKDAFIQTGLISENSPIIVKIICGMMKI